MKNGENKNKKTHSVFKKAQGLLTIVLIAVIIILLKFGGGPGFGKGSGDRSIDAYKNVTDVSESDFNDGTVTTATETPQTSQLITTSSEPDAEIFEIMVSGHDYLYMNEKTELDDFIAKLKKSEKKAEIRISADNTATMNTMEDLTEALDKNGFTDYYKVK